MTDRYPNKRQRFRGPDGRFRRTTRGDVGIGGVCPACQHLLLRHYDGDPREPHLDPHKFRARCFTCEPLTEAEQALAAESEASKPKRPTIIALLERHLTDKNL